MLLSFKFKNFRSFRDEAELNLVASRITEHPSHLIELGKERVLRVAAIYGANASGKSNIHRAFQYMTSYVIASFSFGGEDAQDENKKMDMPVTPFLFDVDSIKKPSSFEIIFTEHSSNEKVYKYGFEILKSKILNEYLYQRPKNSKSYKKIFTRTGKTLQFCSEIKEWQKNIAMSLEPETLIISLGTKLKVPCCKMVRDWFHDNEIITFSNAFESLMRESGLPNKFVDDEDVQNDVIKYLHAFDMSITRFNIEKANDTQDRYIVDACHGEYKIPLREESAGTIKMFTLYSDLKKSLSKGGILFIDELNERLHPKLVESLVKIFLDNKQNPNNAQLIFTTHDLWLLGAGLFRRDEMLFAKKNIDEASSINALSDITDSEGNKIRKDENFVINYMKGKYGAIPEMEMFNIMLN